ncbi:MAG: ferredoxin [Cyanobacteria bacterium P01_D01_bin.105]
MADTSNFQADQSKQQPSGLAPELGGVLRGAQTRTGLEPELGGQFRQKGVYVDELTCIGCTHCAHVARNTFYIEPDYGRARVIRQDGDSEELVQEAIDTCPVNCIHEVDYTELRELERDRKNQVIPVVGFPVDKAVAAVQRRRRQANIKAKRSSSGNADA